MNSWFYKSMVLLILGILFLAPGIAALYVFKHPNWLHAKPTNRGELLKPPLLLPSLAASDKWHVVYWTPESCQNQCKNEMDQLHKVRLALGRHFYEVEENLLTGDAAVKPQHFGVLPRIFIANPQGYLVLAYRFDAPLDDIYQDLNHLIATTKERLNVRT